MTTFSSFTSIDVPGIPLSDIYRSASGVDDAGEVVGSYGYTDGDGDSYFQGFVDNGDVVSSFNPPTSSNILSIGITESGEIFATYIDYRNEQHGFIYSNGKFDNIDYFLATTTNLVGVNAQGVIYGDYVTDLVAINTEILGFVDVGGNFTSIVYPGSTYTVVTGVNVGGEIVGSYGAAGDRDPGFSDINGVLTSFNPAGSYNTSVLGVTDGGEIVGTYADAAGNYHGFVVNNGVITTIDVLGATSTMINGFNDSGELAGTFVDSASNVHGFVYGNGAFTEIDAPGATETEVNGITASGEIFGDYNNAAGQHAFTGVALMSLGVPVVPQGTPPGALDFNGDGKADVLWRQTGTESLAIWLMNGSTIASSAAPTFQGSALAPDSSWSIAALGDFNGDGRSDILWRQSSTGELINWQMNGFTVQLSNAVTFQGGDITPDGSWRVSGIGDFSGGGNSKILWRQSSTGSLAEWLMNGSTVASSASLTYQGGKVTPDSSWSVAGIGDFNGDGDADVLWRQSSTGALAEWTMNGATISSSANLTYQGSAVMPDSSWSVVGVGDFNGDGDADILWRQSTTGSLAVWLMNGSTVSSSAYVTSGGNAVAPDSTWSVVEVGDFNGGSPAGILWQQSGTGALAEWLMNGAHIVSSQTVTSGGAPVAPVSWQVQATPTDFA